MSNPVELHAQAINPATPADERHDINAELWNEFKGALDFPDQDDVRAALQPLIYGDLSLKATRLEPYTYRRNVSSRGRSSILEVNEFGLVGGMGNSRWTEPAVPGGFNFLNDVVGQVDILKAVILTRCRQVLSFCQPERENEPLGFTFRRRDGKKIGKSDEQRVRRLEEWVLNCGDEADPRRRRRLRRDSMQAFIHKHLWDSLSADAAPVELEATRNGRSLAGLYAVPFTTVRLCTEEGYEGDDEICGLQLIDEVPHVTYTYDDLLYPIRNPRSDLVVGGYGFSETEMVVRALTAYLNAFTYNAAGLDRNSAPRGILLALGNFDRRQLNAFRNNLDAMMSGAGNRWKLPMLAGEKGEGGGEMKYVPLDNNLDEMLLAKWMTLLVSIVCGVHGMDPNEISFDSFSAHNSSPLSGKDTTEKLAHSRDKGLVPLLKHVKQMYNSDVIPLIDPDYLFEFTGLDEEDKEIKAKRLELTSTIDELRDLDGRDPHPDEVIGAAPASQTHLNLYMQERQMEMQQEQGAGGDEDYPQKGDGEHTPYAAEGDGGKAPGGPHLHTLSLGEDEAVGKAKGPASARPFLVVVEHAA